ncbi:MAG TPA: aldo/keto reductase [bacterium]|nr:aldo/keto reductase [bacterium]
METRNLGNTGIQISAISLGGVAFTWLGKKSSQQLIDFCVESGINYFDVYAGTHEKIRNSLKKYRDNIIISTRGTPKTIDQYLQFFEIDYFDIFLLSMVDSNQQLKQAIEDAEKLEKFRKQGKFKILGIATHNPCLYLDILQCGAFQVMMLPLNCVDEIQQEIFQKAKDKGIGIIAMKPMAGGNIREYESAIKYVLDKDVSTALIGMAKITEVRQNLRVLQNLEITEKDISVYKKIRKKLGKVFCRYCGHCIFPEPCPNEIPVRTIMMLETLAFQANLRRTVSEKVLKSIEKCSRCGMCETRCPYKLPIRKLLPEKVKMYLKMTR